MKVAVSRRSFFHATAAGALGLVTGCGTLMHPERRYAPNDGRLDWGIVALDGLGLLLFFIPGVIAFAVDFTTGAIYLPPSGYGDNSRPPTDEQLVTIEVPPTELSRQRVEEVASKHTGRDVRLISGEYKTTRLGKLTDFWPTWATLRS
jgi:hypothetical protein